MAYRTSNRTEHWPASRPQIQTQQRICPAPNISRTSTPRAAGTPGFPSDPNIARSMDIHVERTNNPNSMVRLPLPHRSLRPLLLLGLTSFDRLESSHILRRGLGNYMCDSGCWMQLRGLEALFNPSSFRARARRSISRFCDVRVSTLHGLRSHIPQSQTRPRVPRFSPASPPTLTPPRLAWIR